MRLTAQQALDMNNNCITGIIIPVNNQDAVNKSYVDNNFVKTPAGSTLNMNNFGITNLMAPVVGSDATTKSYLDNKARNYQLLSGVTSISTDLYTLNTIIFSIMHSHPSRGGHYFPVSGKVLNICHNVVINTGSYPATGYIGLVKNGATMPESESAILQLPQKGMKTNTTPITFAAGDVLAFYL